MIYRIEIEDWAENHNPVAYDSLSYPEKFEQDMIIYHAPSREDDSSLFVRIGLFLIISGLLVGVVFVNKRRKSNTSISLSEEEKGYGSS